MAGDPAPGRLGRDAGPLAGQPDLQGATADLAPDREIQQYGFAVEAGGAAGGGATGRLWITPGGPAGPRRGGAESRGPGRAGGGGGFGGSGPGPPGRGGRIRAGSPRGRRCAGGGSGAPAETVPSPPA